MVIHSIAMSPPTVKITRSRTASARLKSLSNGQHKESLREIIRRADASDCSKKKRNKKLAGVRFADIGGGDLTSTMVLDDVATTSQPCTSSSVETRSVGQTCQPRVHQTSSQAISCIRCGELGHTARLCVTTDPSKPPSALYCKNCSLSYRYTDDTTIRIDLKTCLAHQRSPQKEPGPKHEAAVKVLQKIENMMEKGMPLNGILSVMGLSHEKFNKIKILVHG